MNLKVSPDLHLQSIVECRLGDIKKTPIVFFNLKKKDTKWETNDGFMCISLSKDSRFNKINLTLLCFSKSECLDSRSLSSIHERRFGTRTGAGSIPSLEGIYWVREKEIGEMELMLDTKRGREMELMLDTKRGREMELMLDTKRGREMELMLDTKRGREMELMLEKKNGGDGAYVKEKEREGDGAYVKEKEREGYGAYVREKEGEEDGAYVREKEREGDGAYIREKEGKGMWFMSERNRERVGSLR